MKRFTVLTLSMLIILLASLTSSPVVASSDQMSSIHDLKDLGDISLDQAENNTGQYYPIFDSIESTDTTLTVRERNNTLGEGAIVQVKSYANITFRYAVALNNITDFDSNEVDFRLFADLPEVNTTAFNNTSTPTLELTGSGIPLTYTGDNTTGFINYTTPYNDNILSNATLYYFETTVVNMTAQYVPFYVRDTSTDGLGEDQDDGAYNLLTTQTYYNTSSQDEFYIQNEIVNITGSVYLVNNSNDVLGISYNIDSGNTKFANLTMTGVTNTTGNLSLSDYSPETVITWDSLYYVTNDTLLNMSRTIERIDSKVVDVGDGSPELEVEVYPNHPKGLIRDNVVYSQNFSITYSVTTLVPKGNITQVGLYETNVTNTLNAFSSVNGTLGEVELNKTIDYSTFTSNPAAGVFNTTISTTTDKGLTLNVSYIINIDQVLPEIKNLGVVGGPEIETTDGKVTFDFDFKDENSGVKVAILDLGNGVTVDVSDKDSFTYRYEQFENNVYSISLTVIDLAGNQDTLDGGSVSLTSSTVSQDRAPSIGVIIFFVVLILTLTSFWWGPKVVERFRN